MSFAGKQRHIKLLHTSALEGYESDPVKIIETKGCHLFCTNTGHSQNTNTFLCVAIKRTIQAFELTKSRQKHRKLKDFITPGQVQFLELWSDRLCVGYPSNFAVYSLKTDGHPMVLVKVEDNSFNYITHPPVDSMLAVELQDSEYLLAFSGKFSKTLYSWISQMNLINPAPHSAPF